MIHWIAESPKVLQRWEEFPSSLWKRIYKIGDAEVSFPRDLAEYVDDGGLKGEDGQHGLVDVDVLAHVVEDVELDLRADDGVGHSQLRQQSPVNLLDKSGTWWIDVSNGDVLEIYES